MAIRERMSGNEAVAYAMKQINPDVMGAFPITPSTEIPQYFSKYIADGKVDTEFVAVESEHSAMSVCIGAAAAGARAVTTCRSPSFFAACATFSGSSGSGGSGLPQVTLQKRQLRVQISPRIINVAVCF